MSTKGIIISSLTVLLALPLIWGVLKVAGIDSTAGFFREFWPWALGFVILVGSSIIINLKKKK